MLQYPNERKRAYESKVPDYTRRPLGMGRGVELRRGGRETRTRTRTRRKGERKIIEEYRNEMKLKGMKL